MHVLTRPGPYDPPFVEKPGFNSDWWLESMGNTDGEGTRHLSFTCGDVEVARATVEIDADFADVFEGFDPAQRTLDIELFETSRAARRSGHGRNAIAVIRATWPQFQVVALSMDAD
jgi:hypothetical protein